MCRLHWNKLLAALFFFPSFAMSDCKNLTLTMNNNRKKSLEVCAFNSAGGYASRNCLDKKCKALEATKNAYMYFEITLHTNPAFQICESSGGRSELFQITENAVIRDQGFCFFDKDNSYLTTGLFLELSREQFEKAP